MDKIWIRENIGELRISRERNGIKKFVGFRNTRVVAFIIWLLRNVLCGSNKFSNYQANRVLIRYKDHILRTMTTVLRILGSKSQ